MFQGWERTDMWTWLIYPPVAVSNDIATTASWLYQIYLHWWVSEWNEISYSKLPRICWESTVIHNDLLLHVPCITEGRLSKQRQVYFAARGEAITRGITCTLATVHNYNLMCPYLCGSNRSLWMIVLFQHIVLLIFIKIFLFTKVIPKQILDYK